MRSPFVQLLVFGLAVNGALYVAFDREVSLLSIALGVCCLLAIWLDRLVSSERGRS